ncbi:MULTISPECIES: hypothetical protein [Bacillus]|uniref:Membrane protein n=1 Tax=Bacillus zhangzhouensis TaxID=1178540 RepID=A0A081LB64_9BACI|nr:MULTISPECIES: hypothetical protein [Bacillus]KEP26490.1 membrane protein [Bacillus zhangzhouensis]MDR0126679.1 hypothetical protein [Bacillus zhangzhouensis]PRO43032.1 hypothetical protein C6W18_04100 [Bacillus sp. LLTC93]
MKKKSILLPLTLLAVALYAILSGGQFDIWKDQEKWYTLVLFFGLAFLYQGKKEQETSHVFIGMLMTGLSLHFILQPKLDHWPDTFTMIVFIVGLALFMKSSQKKEYRIESVALIGLGLFLYFFQQITKQLSSLSIPTSGFELYWPYVLMAVSLLLLFLKRK